MTALRVLVVDDSVVARRLIVRALGDDPLVGVVETATNGRVALDKLAGFAPDVVICDIDMPELDGLATLASLQRRRPDLPVIMFSALSGPGARAAFEALRMGAVDCVGKPAGLDRGRDSAAAIHEALGPLLRGLSRRDAPVPAPPSPERSDSASAIDIVVIGVSTGGPNALGEVVPRLPGDLSVPVLIAQHLPPTFTGMLAERLDRLSQREVREAQDGASVEPGEIWVARGGQHLRVRRSETGVRLALGPDAPVNGCRPSVDVLLDSIVDTYGGRALAVIMTGMGRDGLRGCARLRTAGGHVVAQDQASSVVWGMPGAVVGAGIADAIVPLHRLAAEITRRVTRVELVR